MELDFDDTLVRGLRGYVRLVTEQLGLTGECSYVHTERPASAYLALDGRLPGFPDRDVALLWDERDGWSAAVETHSGEDLIVQARFDADALPSPRAVAAWVRALFRDEPTVAAATGPTAHARGDLAGRLAPYIAAALVPARRTA